MSTRTKNWRKLKPSTSVCCAEGRKRSEWIPFTRNTEVKANDLFSHYCYTSNSWFGLEKVELGTPEKVARVGAVGRHFAVWLSNPYHC